jgi:hypothetical protein
MELDFTNCQADAEYRYVTITELLHQHTCIIDFVKLNGESRSMPCTLRDDMLPAATQILKEDIVAKPINYETITVWCTDASAWRAMKTMNVTKINVVPDTWTITLEEDDTGELVLPLPEELLKVKGWKEGDKLAWKDNTDGTWNLSQ